MIQLRDYQTRAIADARAMCASGKRAPLIVSPTGSGKTTIGGEIVRSSVAKGGRALWLAHRKELIDQAADRLRSFGLHVGVVRPGAPPDPTAPVQVASVQTLRARDHRPEASLVVFDEARHYVAAEWIDVAQSYMKAIRVGLDATPERADGAGLGALFDCVVTAATVRELTMLGHLVPCQVICPSAPLDSKTIAQRPVDAYQAHAPHHRCIVFAPHLKAARAYLDDFLNAGIPAALVHGDLAGVERSLIIQNYRDGKIKVLVNVYVLTEGFDDPPTSCAILARGCSTPGIYLQMVGRILRPAPKKPNAILIDLRGVVHVHGMPDEDRRYSLDGKGIRRTVVDEKFCLVCGALMGVNGICDDCGRAPSELENPDVAYIKLVPYEHLRKESAEDRTARLARWIAKGLASGYKPGWALHKYKIVYSEWPPAAVKDAAERMAREVA